MQHDVKVRRATYTDEDKIVELIQKFYTEILGENYGLSFSRENTRELFTKLVPHILLVLVVDDEVEGILAGEIIHAQGSGDRVFQEVCWYVNQAHRKYGMRLFTAVEQACKLGGVQHMVFVRLGTDTGDRIEKFYYRKGFKLLESHYILKV